MATPPVIVLPPRGNDRTDPWTHPELYDGVTLRRMFAYGLDVAILAALAVGLWIVGTFLTVLSFGLLFPVKVFALALLPLVYHIGLLASSGAATLGMRLMGLRLVSTAPDTDQWDGRPTLVQAAIQVVCFFGSVALTGALILLVVLFNARRRTLHDWLAGTVVVRDMAWRHGAG